MLEILIHAKNTLSLNPAVEGISNPKKGWVMDIKIQPCVWGSAELGGDFVRILCDAQKGSVVRYKEQWVRKVDFLVTEFYDNGDGTNFHRIEIFALPEFVSASGAGKVTTDEGTAELANIGATDVVWTDNQVAFSINLTEAGAAELRSLLIDKFEYLLCARRWSLAESVVDRAIAADGVLELSFVELQAAMIDKVAL